MTVAGRLDRVGDHVELEYVGEIPARGPRLELDDPDSLLADFDEGSLVQVRARWQAGRLRVEGAERGGSPAAPRPFQLAESLGGASLVRTKVAQPLAERAAELLFGGDEPMAAEWIPLRSSDDDAELIHLVVAYDVEAVKSKLGSVLGGGLRVIPARHPHALVTSARERLMSTDPDNLEAVGGRVLDDGQTVLTIRTIFPDAELEDFRDGSDGLVEYSSWVSPAVLV